MECLSIVPLGLVMALAVLDPCSDFSSSSWLSSSSSGDHAGDIGAGMARGAMAGMKAVSHLCLMSGTSVPMVKAQTQNPLNPLKRQAKNEEYKPDVAVKAASGFQERNRVIKNFNSQFAHPEGWVGRLVGTILAWKNRERNAWTISSLDIQPNDQVLEIGFGPGQAIQEVTKLAPNGFVAGIDMSDVMVAQASKRNAADIRSGRVLLRQGSESPLPF